MDYIKIESPQKGEFYDISKLDEVCKEYNIKQVMIIGKRSNGKTYSIKQKILNNFNNNGEEFLYVRRWAEDIKSFKLNYKLFRDIEPNIGYKAGSFFYRNNSTVPIGSAQSINQWEHQKGDSSFENTTTILFDEFLTRDIYLNDEVEKFDNIVSTVVRTRNNVMVYMLGNTVSYLCPYFDAFGVNPLKLEKGYIYIITHKTGYKCALEYCIGGEQENTNNNNLYFNRDTATKNKMIVSGDFESASYHTEECEGVKLNDFYRAQKIPFIFEIHGEYFCVRIKNGILIVRSYKPDKKAFIICNDYGRTKEKMYRWSFPFQSMSDRLDRLQQFVLYKLRNGKVIFQSNEVGEMFLQNLEMLRNNQNLYR